MHSFAIVNRYQESLDYLYKRLPVFHKIGKAAYKKDLGNTLALLSFLGNPHKKLRCIHIAGTNGKGSVSSLLHSILLENGYTSALYTSPHLLDFRERIRIGKENIAEDFVADFVDKIKPALDEIDASFFEVTVAMAFDYFAKYNPDICIIEAGLGGRLDSTNVIDSILSIITSIGFDHMDILGSTLAQIATEKAGIIKENQVCIIGEVDAELTQIFVSTAKEKNTELVIANTVSDSFFQFSALKGNYQKHNLKIIYSAMQILRNVGFELEDSKIILGLQNVRINSGLRGRWEVLKTKPFMVADVAHNQEGLSSTMSQFMQIPALKRHFILGFVADKDLRLVLPLFPKDAKYYFVKPTVFRGMDSAILQEKAEEFGIHGKTYLRIEEAWNAAKTEMTEKDALYIGGSTFLVSDFLGMDE